MFITAVIYHVCLTIEHSISLYVNMKTATVNNLIKGFLA